MVIDVQYIQQPRIRSASNRQTSTTTVVGTKILKNKKSKQYRESRLQTCEQIHIVDLSRGCWGTVYISQQTSTIS